MNSLSTLRIRVTAVSWLCPVLSKPASLVGRLPKSGITRHRLISPDYFLLLPSLFMMKKQQQWEADSHEGTASNWFCFGVVHILGVWHSLHPLSNNGSSVAVVRPVGQAVHFTLWLLFTWKRRMRSGSSRGDETATFQIVQNEDFGSRACRLLWQLTSSSKESVYMSRTSREEKQATFTWLIHIILPEPATLCPSNNQI